MGVSEIRRSLELGVVVWCWRDVTWRLASFCLQNTIELIDKTTIVSAAAAVELVSSSSST